jgi:hypothetical protein
MNLCLSVEIGFKSMKKSYANTIIKEKDIPNMPVYWQGWIKYLEWNNDAKTKPKAFFQNIEYDVQSREIPSDKLNEKDPVVFKY